MNARFRKPVFVLLIPLCACAAALIGWRLLPLSTRAAVYRTFPYRGSYFTYERLADSLRLGMNIEDVRGVLGKPQTQEALAGGQRWTFIEDGPTAGWTCIVDFSSEAGTLRLSYFFNVQHRVFTNSLHREIGAPMVCCEFRIDPFLKMRRDQWHRTGGANHALQATPDCAVLFFLALCPGAPEKV